MTLPTVPQEVTDELITLDNEIRSLILKRKKLKVKYKIGIECCRHSSCSNGWHHSTDCPNYVIAF